MPAVNRTSMSCDSTDPISLARMSGAAGVFPLYNVNSCPSDGPLGLARNWFLSPKMYLFGSHAAAKDSLGFGGAYRNRTDDILLAKQALSHLS